MNTLLCTLSNTNDFSIIEKICQYYVIAFKKIYLLKEVNSQNSFIFTYNIMNSTKNIFLENTFLIHRKKEFNVLYTINALNLLAEQNNMNPMNYVPDWHMYRNSLLLNTSNKFKAINTELVEIISL